jgi:hypothetical protein
VPFTFTENVQEVFAPRAAPVKITTPVPAVAVIVPPLQVPAINPLGVAITRPAGSVSLKLTPVRAIAFTAVLETVKLREVLPFSGIEAAPKLFEIEAGAPTVRLAVAVFPLPPLLEDTAPVVSVKVPAPVSVTLTVSVQLPPTATEPPLSEMVPLPAVAVTVPPQLSVSPFGVEITRPAGSVSVKATPASATVLAAGLVMVKLSEVVPFSAIVVGLNPSAKTGGATTAILAVAVLPVPPLVEPTVTLLFFAPAVVPVTFKLSVQEAPAASVSPDRLTADEPVAAAAVPVQVVVKPLGVATTRPVGKLSLNPTPLSAIAVTAVLLTV